MYVVGNKQAFRSWLYIAITVLVATAIAITANAQQSPESDVGNGLRISPVRQEFILTPGQQDSYTIELTNVSQADMTVVTVVNDFESDNVTGQPKLLAESAEVSPFSLRDYVILPEPFPLEAGETTNVTIDVAIPEDLSPGGYFGAIRFAPSGDIDVEDGNVALTASVANILLVNVPGDVPEGMTLENIEARKNGTSSAFFESPPDEIAVTLENTGNSLLKPFGQVAVKNIFGNEVYSYELNNTQVRNNVLPQSSRTFEDPLQNISRIGRYTVEANLSFGEGGGTILQGQTTFWVIPWRIILAVLAVVALVVWFATRGIKSYNRRVVDRAKRNS